MSLAGSMAAAGTSCAGYGERVSNSRVVQGPLEMNIRSTGGCSFCFGGVSRGFRGVSREKETAVTNKSTMQSLHSLLVVDIRST